MRPLALTLAFLLGLTCSAAVLRRVAAFNQSPTGGRLEHLAAHRSDYDLIVLGPSYTEIQFLPPIFDARMKELGHPVHSFGFGMSGLHGGEFDFYLHRILELDMPKLKWLLCDVTLDQRKPIEPDNAFKRRTIYWSDPARFAFMLDAIGAATQDQFTRLTYALRHARHTLVKLGNIGEGVEALREDAWFDPPKVHGRSTFYMHESVMQKQAPKAARYLRTRKRLHERAAKYLAQKRAKKKKPRDNDIMARWRDEIRAQGVEPVFVISPVLSYAAIETHVPGSDNLRVLDFDDPKKYRDLYQPNLHYDPSHLHYEGAVLFSRHLAEVFARTLDKQAEEHTR